MRSIAIVGQACLLPGAQSPGELNALVRDARVVIGAAPEGRWRIDREHAMSREPASDRTFSDRGGYVEGFTFDPSGFAMEARELEALDPLFHWVLHTGREAIGRAKIDRARTGAIFGNLSFPTSKMAELAESKWLAGTSAAPGRVDPRNRFMSGLPAHLLGRALGLGSEVFALDAACASSLYALSLACDALDEGRADAMLAGAVCRADDLFIHVGFCALSAMSRSGQSRPFDEHADGLVPAEGAAMLLLKRLEDAERAGDRILGVIRGIGLSNDGRGRGLLAPSSEGQARAMRAAYAQAGWTPADVSYVECHATGTRVGDAAEIASLTEVFGEGPSLPIGSLKANMGHAITVAGAASLLKVLGAMEAGVFPATPGVDDLAGAVRSSRFRVLDRPEPWIGPKRAAISAFGFGGNNAHVLVEAYEKRAATPKVAPANDRVAIVAMGARIASGDLETFQRAIEDGASQVAPHDALGRAAAAADIELPLNGLRTPPRDLEVTLAQQTMLLAATLDATAGRALPRERTMIVVGMGCDAEIARYGARWRTQDRAWKDAFAPALRAEGVLGTMPNIVANRLNGQLDVAGPSFTVSSEELSGMRALQIAARALVRGDVDCALACAVDLSVERVHVESLAAVTGEARTPGDAAVVLVLKRVADAKRDGDRIVAEIDLDARATGTPLAPHALDALVGHAHAASALVHVAAAALALDAGTGLPGATASDRIDVHAVGLLGPSAVVSLVAPSGPRRAPSARPARGPSLRLPAHLPPPVLREARRIAVPDVQRMERAPALVPILDRASVLTTAAPLLAAPSFVSPTSAPAMLTSGLETVLSRLGDHTRAIAETHRAMVASQAETHAQFLAMHARASEQFLAAYSNAGQLAPVPMSVPRSGSPAVSAPVSRSVAVPVAAPVPIAVPVPVPVAVPVPVPASVAASSGPHVLTPPRAPVGPRFDRAALETHASGKISDVFGAEFRDQDQFTVQVRMPEPPLLLADRVTGIDAKPQSMGKGVLWTETDVKQDAYYMHAGRMPTGILIESGQADLMLVSYLGIDALNRGERSYRLLGCELVFHDTLPKAGDTLCYQIHGDGFASQGDVRLFFFHYDCYIDGKPMLSVREGQAGFFTKEELAGSAGILWTAETHVPEKLENDGGKARLDAPRVRCEKRSFSNEDLRLFADEGDALACFGAGFERAAPHTRTPNISGGKMRFFDEVTHFDVEGGPWKRGYLRATQAITKDDWFFAGHFKNDPCMPGTLMFDGCLSAMAFYLAGLGYTLDKDGYRFEPVTNEAYKLKCRGQVIPGARELVYEVFVEEVHDGDEPRLYADLLCTVDGLPAFHARRMALRLVPDWPMTSTGDVPFATKAVAKGTGNDATRLLGSPEPKPVANIDGHALDHRSLIACAWGQPSTAFGPKYARFDGSRRVARLPGPPYHFVSRVLRTEGEPFVPKAGAAVEVEYDIPESAWYFDENGARTMPFAVLLEAALQPCGWLASYVGCTLTTDIDLAFRNLDGKGEVLAEVFPDSGTLRTTARLTNVSAVGGMLIVSFEVECLLGETKVYALSSVFGFFPKAALENQVGLPTTDAQRAVLEAPVTTTLDLVSEPVRYFGGGARVGSSMLRMIDRVTAFDSTGGSAGKGSIRAEMDVDPRAWFFKAHFFQDPVQPGSLGIEAMLQTLEVAMLSLDLDRGIESPRFESIEVNRDGKGEHSWKYRGQVVPQNKRVTVTMDLTEVGRDEHGVYARGDASLWVDGKRIYEAKNVGKRIVSAPRVRKDTPDEILEGKGWLADHCPTYAIPALPMMSMMDRLAGALPELRFPLTFEDVKVHRWVTTSSGPIRLQREAHVREDGAFDAKLFVYRDARDPKLSRFELAATGVLRPGFMREVPAIPALRNARREPTPYGTLFHGPAFHHVSSLEIGEGGSRAILDAGAGSVPRGTLHQGLLDAMTHGIPHDRLSLFAPEIPDDRVAYPHRIASATIYEALPDSGHVTCEARFAGFDGDPRFPVLDLWLVANGRTLATMRLVEILMPKGPLGVVSPDKRAAFLRDRRPVEGVSLSREERGETELSDRTVAESDWLPGTMKRIYALETSDAAREIAIKEHIGRRTGRHPSSIVVDARGASTKHEPLTVHPIDARRDAGAAHVRSSAPRLDLDVVRDFWSSRFGLSRWPVEDICYGLAERFVSGVHIEDPAAWDAIRGRSVVYLANHQTGIESILFSILAAALQGTTTMTLAKAEHRETWLGRMIQLWFRYPGAIDPGVIAYFDRTKASSLLTILTELAQEMRGGKKSILVHVEGTRSLSCARPVTTMSGAFVDLALGVGAPIVPVRFANGLPTQDAAERLEFPLGMGTQAYHFGKPILPEELSALPYKDRSTRVMDAINALAGPNEREQPSAPDADFEARVRAWQERTGATLGHSTIFRVMEERKDACDETRRFVESAKQGHVDGGEWFRELGARLLGQA